MFPQTDRAGGRAAAILLLAALALAGCSSAPALAIAEPIEARPEQAQLEGEAQLDGLPAEPQSAAPAGQPEPESQPAWQPVARTDSQGAVEFSVVPLSLSASDPAALEFQIAMNTHSVDLSMDLAPLSSLENDLGVSVPAGAWSGGSGHHVIGVLSFPAHDGRGLAMLDGASALILSIESVDAPLRVFRWEIGQSQ